MKRELSSGHSFCPCQKGSGRLHKAGLQKVEPHKPEKTSKLSPSPGGHDDVGFDSCNTRLFYPWFLSCSTHDNRPSVSVLDFSSSDFPVLFLFELSFPSLLKRRKVKKKSKLYTSKGDFDH